MTMQNVTSATPHFKNDKKTQNLSRGNINDSCEHGMIISHTSLRQTPASSLFEFHIAKHTVNKHPNNHNMKILRSQKALQKETN